ncbi:glycosyltransferase [Pseudomonas putida]|uniref:glycosyltransferase n=1 Tax=Pseudomonas TaxID=286 RepID=UPI00062A2CC9|nr:MULTISPECIES: glycosyltransferase [Pseudomonas]KAF1307431.1 glycosyl transferase family 1 [Pseudomonas sp. SG-MS2]
MSDDFYRALEERFRASREVIRSRLEGYTPFIAALRQAKPIPKAFDIGCGRGEWLQLLMEHGLDAQGVDLDDSMLAACQERGLNARNQDALEALQGLPEASLDLISAFHVVEHLTFDYLRALLKEANRTLSEGGLLILETPNAENLIVGTTNFYLDPTHKCPVPAQFLEFLCQYSGFAQSKIVRLQEDPQLKSEEAHIGLWQVLYGVSPDYAIVARKCVPTVGERDVFGELFAQSYGLELATLAQRHDRMLQEQFRAQGEYIDHLAKLSAANIDHFAKLCTANIERIEKVQVELQLIYSSRSWRITRPMRELADTLRHMDRVNLKRTLAMPLFTVLGYVSRRPKLLGVLRKAIKAVPGLERHLRKVTQALGRMSQPVLSDLLRSYSPRVLQLSKRLHRLLESASSSVEHQTSGRPRLAYVSPMPPDRTGIADYSAELLPALARYYDIDVIVDGDDAAQVQESLFPLREAAWLRQHASQYSAVLYHFGNSPWHCYMAELIEDVPGIIVLHDFYLSGLIWSMESRPGFGGVKMRELYYSHGYAALIEAQVDERQVAVRYPFNRSILEKAQGVIVHSAVSVRLVEQWYGSQAATDWTQIPLLRELAASSDDARHFAREALGLTDDAFVVCSFGMLGETKLNDKLISAWLASDLASDSRCHLVFVGELGSDEYCERVRKQLVDQGERSRITVTGWADSSTFKHYLFAADLAVQLRSLSRGETSAAVLDCMNYRLATIVNANGSMADLPEQGVYRLPDQFDIVQLAEALQFLRHDEAARTALGQRAREFIEQQHTPQHCAALYHTAIEQYAQRNRQREQELVQVVSAQSLTPGESGELLGFAESILQGTPDPLRPRQLLLDISGTCAKDRHSGIERVAKALTLALLKNPPAGVRVEPVYLSNAGGRWHYRYANAFTNRLLNLPDVLTDRAIDYSPADQLIAFDISGNALVQASQAGLFKRMQASGVNCRMLVHDLLPVTRPELFPPQADRHFSEWLWHVSMLDGVVCVTETVAGEFRKWMQKTLPQRMADFTFDYSHHGADLANSSPSMGLPADAQALLAIMAERPTVLMVGTLEPRKGYLQALEAFSLLWRQDFDVNLVIVGRAGWQELPTNQQRNIPQLLERLANHPEKSRRMFWLDGPSDEFLERVYTQVDGLLAASEDEGFGLPLIEAGQKGLPILARDIPVFREVAGDHACYFRAQEPQQLADAITQWVRQGFKPSSIGMPWLTWQQSADNLQRLLFRGTSEE